MVTSADWPVPFELQQLIGHKNEVIQTEFSHEGTRLATGSLDGSVRVGGSTGAQVLSGGTFTPQSPKVKSCGVTGVSQA